ncbi:TPA: hypothetical protein ACIAIE_002644 [Serratia fonticola]
MMRNESRFVMIYLSCAFSLMLFFMSLIFHVLGYWVIGLLGYWVIGLLGYWVIGEEGIIEFIKTNIHIYLKMAGLGFIAGFILWLFKIR